MGWRGRVGEESEDARPVRSRRRRRPRGGQGPRRAPRAEAARGAPPTAVARQATVPARHAHGDLHPGPAHVAAGAGQRPLRGAQLPPADLRGQRHRRRQLQDVEGLQGPRRAGITRALRSGGTQRVRTRRQLDRDEPARRRRPDPDRDVRPTVAARRRRRRRRGHRAGHAGLPHPAPGVRRDAHARGTFIFIFVWAIPLTAYFVYTTGVAVGAGDGAGRPGRLTRHPARGPGAGPSRQRPRPAPVLGRRHLGDEHDGLGRRLELFHVLRDAPRGEFILMLVHVWAIGMTSCFLTGERVAQRGRAVAGAGIRRVRGTRVRRHVAPGTVPGV